MHPVSLEKSSGGCGAVAPIGSLFYYQIPMVISIPLPPSPNHTILRRILLWNVTCWPFSESQNNLSITF